MEALPFATEHPILIVRGDDTSPLTSVPAYPGLPKLVVDSTGTSDLTAVFSSYLNTRFAPHFTLVPEAKEIFQHLDLEGAAHVSRNSPQETHRKGKVVWVCVAKDPSEVLSQAQVVWVGDTVARIAEACGIPTSNVTDFPGTVSSRDKGVLMSLGAWTKFSGIAAAGVVPFVNRFGPGKFDREAFLRGLDRDKTVQDLTIEFPPFRGRPMKVGSKGERVVLLQTVFGLEHTGEFTEELGELISTFKKVHGLEETPTVDSAAWKALGDHVRGHSHS